MKLELEIFKRDELAQSTTRLLVGILFGLIACTGSPAYGAPEKGADENLLKAAFVFNFAKFTRWPSTAWEAEGADLVLCTAGNDGVVEALQQLAGKSVQGHSVNVQSVEKGRSPAYCHVLYIAPSDFGAALDIASAVHGRPVLTVSEFSPSGKSKTVIEFFDEDERIRFIIDLGFARAAGLEFSSRLLSLGIVIHEDEAR